MIELSNYKDIGSAEPIIQETAVQYYRLLDGGRTEEAYALLEENRQLLQPYLFTNESANKIETAIYNLARDVLLKQKIIISRTEPSETLPTGSEWLQPY